MSYSIPVIQPSDVLKVIEEQKESSLFVDVRRQEEFCGELGHINKAQLVSLGTDLTQFLTAGDRQQKIIFICRSGKRSESATLEALNLGYKQAFNMLGGMLAWNELNLPVERK